MEPLPNGYTNRMVRHGPAVTKSYRGPDADGRRERELTVLRALRLRVGLPAGPMHCVRMPRLSDRLPPPRVPHVRHFARDPTRAERAGNEGYEADTDLQRPAKWRTMSHPTTRVAQDDPQDWPQRDTVRHSPLPVGGPAALGENPLM